MSKNPVAYIAQVIIALLIAACLLLGTNTQTPQVHAHTLATSSKLIVYVLGLGEELSQGDAAKNGHFGVANSFYSAGGIQPYLKQTPDFRNAQTMVFSYDGFNAKGQPNPFPCWDTFNNTLAYNVALLNLQINQYLLTHPSTQVYIVAHSLGGAIAFGYAASIVENTHANSLSNGGNLAGIAINSSPLGGVISTTGYISAIMAKAFDCARTHYGSVTYDAIHDLQTLYKTATSQYYYGETASIYSRVAGGSSISNQHVAYDVSNAGVKLVVIGNENELLWRGDVCSIGSNFLYTQYLNKSGLMGHGGALYSRSFTSGNVDCSSSDIYKNHFAALHRKDVQRLIWEVFTAHPVDQLTQITHPNQGQLAPKYSGSISDLQTIGKSLPLNIDFSSTTSPLSGRVTINMNDGTLFTTGPITNGTNDGTNVNFTVNSDTGADFVLVFSGTLNSDNTLDGTWTDVAINPNSSGNWNANPAQ